jgi:hypothetical protein
MFEVHGKWKIEVQNNCVLQWFTGSWNEEAVIKYAQEFLDKTASLNGTEWAIISFFDNWELGTPDIEPHVVKHCQQFIKNGCIKDCHVYTPSVIKNMQLEQMIPITQSNYERLVFGDVQKALNWLASHQFYVDMSTFKVTDEL